MSYVCSDFFVAELQSRCRAPSISCCCLSWRSFRWNEINSKLKRWMIQLEYCNQLEGKNKNNWKVSQSQSPYIINTILCVGWCVCWPLEFTNMMDNMNTHRVTEIFFHIGLGNIWGGNRWTTWPS